MTLKQQRVDVTDRVIGKMKNGEMELFLDNTSDWKNEAFRSHASRIRASF